ncbi:MAG: hypothetical protein FWD64_12380, partial [Acidobacteriaceae bacterium]|nr:hypothetical protein [Acidobacteriaceae bacterium]
MNMRVLFLLSLFALMLQPLVAATPRTHTVTLGPVRRVAYTQPDAKPEEKSDQTSMLRVRALYVDDVQKEWTMGEMHSITDRTFAIRRALRINDALATDKAPRWSWQPGPWLTV